MFKMENKTVPRPVFRQAFPVLTRPIIPAGLETLYAACRRIYPDQPNPLQVTALLKYWLGGPDPLDYISMYSNAGNPSTDIPSHWHYVSFGLSDLHGDGRVHDRTAEPVSGFGFELTFRLKREPEEKVPPTWPAAIMQALAKYVFQSENVLCPGDHVSWHCPLDNSESRIQHMLMFEDPQLGIVQTPYGPVTFVQIVGVCTEELQAAQGWNGPGIIDIMKTVKGAGGPWLITDMRRGETIFELDSSVQEAVDQGVETDGSNLSGVSAKCSWQEKKPVQVQKNDKGTDAEAASPHISVLESEQIRCTLKKGLITSKPVLPQIRPNSSNRYYGISAAADKTDSSKKDSSDNNANSEVAALEPAELTQIKFLDSVHLQFNLEAGSILPLALRGRLKHGRHFTFKSVVGSVAITLVPPTVSGSFVHVDHPFATHGAWLQVLLTDEEIDLILNDLNGIDHVETALPKTFEWKDKKLSITLMPENY